MEWFYREEGFILVIIPFIISIVLLFAAFGLDIGYAFVLKHQLQSAADAAALAGTSATTAPFARDEHAKIIPDVVDVQIDPNIAEIEAMLVLDENISLNKLEEKGVTILEKKGEVIDKRTYKVIVKAKIKTLLAFGTGKELYQTITAIARVRN